MKRAKLKVNYSGIFVLICLSHAAFAVNSLFNDLTGTTKFVISFVASVLASLDVCFAFAVMNRCQRIFYSVCARLLVLLPNECTVHDQRATVCCFLLLWNHIWNVELILTESDVPIFYSANLLCTPLQLQYSGPITCLICWIEFMTFGEQFQNGTSCVGKCVKSSAHSWNFAAHLSGFNEPVLIIHMLVQCNGEEHFWLAHNQRDAFENKEYVESTLTKKTHEIRRKNCGIEPC